LGANGTAARSRFDGRCVNTIVRSSPMRSASLTATWKEPACSSPTAKKTTASVSTEAPKRRVNQ
jgi:hypothetical protein